MSTIHPARWKALAAVGALCLTPALAACGSDDDSSDAGGSGGSKDPIKVMVYGPFDAQGFSVNSVRTGAQAGVAKVNAEGGINGRDLELIVCNDNNDPNGAADCARQAVSEGVVAVVGGVSVQEQQLLPGLEKAGIPVIGNFPIANFTSEVTYPFVGGGAGVIFALGKIAAENATCGGDVSIVQEEFSATAGVNDLYTLAVTASGGTVAQIGKAPQGSADFAPAVASALDGSGCLVLNASPTAASQIVSAIGSSGTRPSLVAAADTMVPGAMVEALGAAAEGITVANEFLPLNETTDTAAMKDFLERGRAVDKDFDPEAGGASAFIAPQLLKVAIEDAGVEDITPESIRAALDEVSEYDTGLGPVLDFTRPNPTTAFARLPFGGVLNVWVAKGGRYVLDDSIEPVSIDAIYEAAAAAGK